MKPIILKLQQICSKSAFLKKTLKPIYHKIFIDPKVKRRKHEFTNHGLQIMDEFDKCMTANGHPYFLIFGTLLGAVREKGFIKHDFDIDVAMWDSDYSDRVRLDLEKVGFRLKSNILIDGGKSGREETYEKDGVGIDIFYVYDAIEKYPYTCFSKVRGNINDFESAMKIDGGLLPVRYQLPFTHEYERVPFESLMLPIPTTAHQILCDTYGETYMIPNPNWIAGSCKTAQTEWPEKMGVYTIF